LTSVSPATRDALAGISGGRAEILEETLDLHESVVGSSGLDGRTLGLVQIAALIALDAPPAAYARQVANAIEWGASADDMLGVLRAVAPHVGAPRAVAAAPELMLALGLTLPESSQ